jgi:hypothetical protein
VTLQRRILSANATFQHQSQRSSFSASFRRRGSAGVGYLAGADELVRVACTEVSAGIHRFTLGQLAAVFASTRLSEQGFAPLAVWPEALSARDPPAAATKEAFRFGPVADTPGFA